MFPTKIVYSGLRVVGLVLILLARPASGEGCNDELSLLRNRVVQLFTQSRPAPPVPDWVNQSREIDAFWWHSASYNHGGASIRELRFKDKTTYQVDGYLGEGADGVTYCFNACSLVIKLPTASFADKPRAILDEVPRASELHRAGYAIAPVLSHSKPNALPYVIKPFVTGDPLRVVRAGKMSAAQIDDLAKIYATGVRTGIDFDLRGFNYDNLIWNPERQVWILVDLDAKGSPEYFQPFDKILRDGNETTSALHLYRTEVFNGDESATLRFREKAMELLRKH